MNGDVGRSEPEPPPLPRKIRLERTSEGYGFNLHGEKGIHGQFISAIDEGSPAQLNDIRVGDRVIGVNDEDVEDLPHSKVVEKIRANGSNVTLLVVDEHCDEYYKNLGVKIPQDKYEIVMPKDSVSAPEIVEHPVSNGGEEVSEVVVPEQNGEVESSPPPPEPEPTPVLEKQTEEKPSESVEQQNDEYEEVVPLASSTESAPKPVETTPAVEGTVEEKANTVPTITTTTSATTEVEVQSPTASTQLNNFDKPTTRAQPKRKEVKLATQDWKKKYEDFNKL